MSATARREVSTWLLQSVLTLDAASEFLHKGTVHVPGPSESAQGHHGGVFALSLNNCQ